MLLTIWPVSIVETTRLSTLVATGGSSSNTTPNMRRRFFAMLKISFFLNEIRDCRWRAALLTWLVNGLFSLSICMMELQSAVKRHVRIRVKRTASRFMPSSPSYTDSFASNGLASACSRRR